jgi:hypothetical protein
MTGRERDGGAPPKRWFGGGSSAGAAGSWTVVLEFPVAMPAELPGDLMPVPPSATGCQALEPGLQGWPVECIDDYVMPPADRAFEPGPLLQPARAAYLELEGLLSFLASGAGDQLHEEREPVRVIGNEGARIDARSVQVADFSFHAPHDVGNRAGLPRVRAAAAGTSATGGSSGRQRGRDVPPHCGI